MEPRIEKERIFLERGPSAARCDVLLPENPQIQFFPGFQLDGKEWPVKGRSAPYFNGAGHLEIEPEKLSKGPGKNLYFLNVLRIGAKNDPLEPPGKVSKNDKEGVKLQLAGYELHFSSDGKQVKLLRLEN
jgi:hypothetical protein